MSPAHPVAVVDDSLVIEYGQFLLQGIGSRYHASRLPVDFATSWRMAAGPGGALFLSDSIDREIPIRLELWAAEPPAPDGPWEQATEGVLDPDSARLRIMSITGALTPHVLELQRVGPQHVRGFLQITLDEADAEEHETDIQEQWLIQLWPVTG